jgi:hypothetical protein
MTRVLHPRGTIVNAVAGRSAILACPHELDACARALDAASAPLDQGLQ